ncbi:MAG: glucans biosynthesis glucosyltransferase MdoH [Woeseiaceae bacterium]
MGPDVISNQQLPRYTRESGDVSPWQEAMPRMHAYLRAAGFGDPERLPGIVAAVERRLQPLLPLHPGENTVEVAMRETVQWVDEQEPRGAAEDAAAASDLVATPLRAGLPMHEQTIELRRLRRPRGSASSKPGRAAERPPTSQPESDPAELPSSAAARGIRARRAMFVTLVLATTAGAIALLSGSVQQDGLSPLELLLVLLYAVLFAWICAAFWTAFIGFFIRLFRIRRWDIGASSNAAATPRGTSRTALVMPVYNEEPVYVFARLRAIWESLSASAAAGDVDLYILSDTRDPDIWVEEELRWRNLCKDLDGAGRIFYRNRADNTYRKAGNIADFVRSWGAKYRYMAVLDADSLMSGETVVQMVRIMEAHPRVAILQAPPVPVNNNSLFARLLQFATALYGPIFSAGTNFWQAGDASYFGHNALIRVEPFAAHCGLPTLPGREPLGGPILSHDFVEAATLRRAGWESWLAHGLSGSYEEIPPTLIDYAKRDRRWCQGNLQHGRLVAARGWRGLSRLHLGMAVMSYLASPLWFLFLLATGVEAWLQSQETPVYFFGHSLFPVWPTSYAFELKTVLIVTLSILFLPKVLALLALVFEPRRWRLFGGPLRAAVSVILETLFSMIVAPVLMLFQSKFVTAILLHRNVGWPTQQRLDRVTTFGEAVRAHGSQVALGIAAGLLTWFYVPGFFWWFTPVLLGILLAIPVSMLSSRADLGFGARRAGLFLTPDEVQPAPVIRRYHEILEQQQPLAETGGTEPLWLAALLRPHLYSLHRRMLPDHEPTRRQRHELEGTMYTLIDESEGALTPAERRAMIANESCFRRIHIGLWSELPLERLTGSGEVA